MDQALLGTNLEVEVPEEVHPDQAVDVLVAEREDRQSKVGRRHGEHLRKHILPRNSVVALSGSFDPKVVKAQIEEDFGSLADLPKPKGPVVPEAAVTKEKRVRGEASVALPRVAMLWGTPAFLDPEDASFDGIANILDERLTKKYVEGTKVTTAVEVHKT